LFVDRTELGIRFMESCQRLFSRFTTVGLLREGAGQCRHQFLAAPLGALEFGGGRIDRRLHLDGRRPVAGAATAPAGADEVAVSGDHPERTKMWHSSFGGVEHELSGVDGVGYGGVSEEQFQCAAQFGGCRHNIERPCGAWRQRCGAPACRIQPADEHRGPTAFVLSQR